MTNKKSTKRALLASVIALMLCVAMLAGTTYAWFTDNVVSNNNIIKAGNLDVELYWSTDASNWEKVDENTNVFKEDTLWEPGHTEVVYLKVVNEGSLALKYNLGINVVSETVGTNVAGDPFKLSQYIKFDVLNVCEGDSFDRAAAVSAVASTAKPLYYGYGKDASMTAGAEDYVAMVVYMPETVGNEANYKTGTAAPTINLGINLFATQYTYEADSYGSDYDADALVCDVLAYPDTLADVLANAQEGDVIGLANVSHYGGVITIPVNNLTLVSNGALVDSIDLNGKDNITIDGLTFDPNRTTIDVSKYNQATASCVDTGYNANITNTTSTPYGADNIVIKNCTFIEGIADLGFDASTYCAIAIEDAGRVSGSTTNLTVENCTFRSNSFEHLRLNYIGGDIVIKNNNFQGATIHHNINASGNKGNWTIIGNSFSNWGDGEYAFGTARNGSNILTLIIEGNSFTKAMDAGDEIPVLSIKSSYTADNSIVVVENNVANAGAATIDAAIRSDYKYYMTASEKVSVANNASALQEELNGATGNQVIVLSADITGAVTVPQSLDTVILIDGGGNDFNGTITIDGKSGTYATAGLMIANVNFVADSINSDACIQLGKSGDNNTRYTTNVTIKNCTFDVPGAVGVKSYTGGDKNLKVIGCTATSVMHSLVQVAGVDDVLIENCTVNSKNGANFNQSEKVTISGCTFDTQGYAVRFGASSGATGAEETYLIKDSKLKSACDDDDAVIILRGTAESATLTISNTTITGTIEISNLANANVIK